MWSLFKKKDGGCGDNLDGGIFSYSNKENSEESGEKLPPLKFSNGKTQEDVVREVLDEIEKGSKIIFIRGVCGTGKSAVALNLARHFKKTSIVVPIKSLQEQYENDYTRNNFILKKDKKQLKIAVIKGRNNFHCPFLNSNAAEEDLPCTIELREKNIEQIMKYIEQNEDVSKEDFSSVSDVRRMSIAPVCPYWSPLLPAEVSSKVLEKARKKKYKSISGEDFALFKRKTGCGYYDQYENYIDADVLIFNSMKYLIETAMGRKPKTDLDIIDECDEFLDSFANEKRINLNRLVMALSNLFPDTREKKEIIKNLINLSNSVMFGSSFDDGERGSSEILKLKETKMLELIEKVIDNPYLAEEEDENYYNNVFEVAKSFEHLLDETYVSIEKVSGFGNSDSFNNGKTRQKGLFGMSFEKSKKEDTVYVNLVSINLAQKFKDIIDSNNVLVLMSGTLHSEKVLKDIFGLKDFKIIEAESQMPGTVTKYRTGLEKNCKYENFKSGNVTREQYLRALGGCIKNAKPPILVHVNSFQDLPTELEKAEFNLDVISREKLKEMQGQERSNSEVDKFRQGEIDLLFTTKCSRGVDFPGEKCNSIILTKYPYPNIQGLFWRILKKERPDKFFEFYYDKASRELTQKIARGVRFKGDHVLLLSPDVRVIDARIS